MDKIRHVHVPSLVPRPFPCFQCKVSLSLSLSLSLSPSHTAPMQAVGPSVPTVNHPKSPGLFASVSHFQGRELLTRLAATTLNSLRTVSKVKHEEETRDIAEFSSIKKSLTFSAEDECGWKVKKSTNSFTDNLSDSQFDRHTSNRRDFRRECVHPELVPKDQFYVLEPELCNLLMSGEGGGMAQHCIGGRGQCPSPIAHLLDNVYFVPITNNY